MSSLPEKYVDILDVRDIVELASDLISVESHRDAPGRERKCAEKIYAIFSSWGLKPELVNVSEDRPNVYCTLKGSGGGVSLIFNAHTDTIPAYDMDIAPFQPKVEGGLLYGRGAVDMKGPLACMMAAMRLLFETNAQLKGDLIFTGVIDEEERSEGSEFLVRRGPYADRCVVGEPTGLAIMAGHRGLEWLEFEFIGKAAHGGLPDKGRNAISMAAHFIRRVEERLIPQLTKRIHPLIGPASMNFGVIKGGTQPSTIADRCILQVDRRWVPMERLDEIFGEYQAIIDDLAADYPGYLCKMSRIKNSMSTMEHLPVEIPRDDFLVKDLEKVLIEIGISEPKIAAFSGWTDASLISNFANIPTLIFGPGDLSVAHSRREYISVEDLYKGTLAYALLAESLCSRSSEMSRGHMVP